MLGENELQRALLQTVAINGEHGNTPESYMHSEGIDWQPLEALAVDLANLRAQRVQQMSLRLKHAVESGSLSQDEAGLEIAAFVAGQFEALFLWALAIGMSLERLK